MLLTGELNGQSVFAGGSPDDYQAVQRGPHHTVWSRLTMETNAAGFVFLRTNSFTQLGNGLNRFQNGEWAEANPRIISTTNGAIGVGAQHWVVFAPNLYTRGAIQIRTPEGTWLKSHVLGLAYHDSQLKTNVLIAQIRDSFGELAGSNQVVYPNALSGVSGLRADVRYEYRRSGLAQNVVLKSRPPLPQSLGLNPNSTHLLATTEFVDTDAPRIQEHNVAAGTETMKDDTVAFDSMRTVKGRAFAFASQNSRWRGARVYKTFEDWSGRKLLLERVRFPRVKDELLQLPATANTNRTASVSPRARWFANSNLPVEQRLARTEPAPMKQMASLAGQSGFGAAARGGGGR